MNLIYEKSKYNLIKFENSNKIYGTTPSQIVQQNIIKSVKKVICIFI